MKREAEIQTQRKKIWKKKDRYIGALVTDEQRKRWTKRHILAKRER